MGGEHGDPVDLLTVRHTVRARWQYGHPHRWDMMYVAVGELDDGRWYVEVVGQVGGARAYATKQAAWVVARRWLGTRQGDWMRVE